MTDLWKISTSTFIPVNEIKTLEFLPCGVYQWLIPRLQNQSKESTQCPLSCGRCLLIHLTIYWTQQWLDGVNFLFINKSVSRKVYSFKTENLHTHLFEGITARNFRPTLRCWKSFIPGPQFGYRSNRVTNCVFDGPEALRERRPDALMVRLRNPQRSFVLSMRLDPTKKCYIHRSRSPEGGQKTPALTLIRMNDCFARAKRGRWTRTWRTPAPWRWSQAQISVKRIPTLLITYCLHDTVWHRAFFLLFKYPGQR